MKNTYINILKRVRILLCIMAFVVAATSSTLVHAISENDINSIYGHSVFYDIDWEGTCGGTPGAGGSNVYVIGDSLTVGMRDSGSLETKLTDANWEVTGIQATGGYKVSDSIPKLDEDAALVSNSDNVVVMLGTNKDSDFEAQQNAFMAKVKELSPNARVFWMNAYTEAANYDDINGVIDAKAGEHGYTVIDWKTEYLSNPAGYPLSADGIHHTGAGYAAKSDYLVETLGTPLAGGADFSGENNAQIAFNYFVSKGLTKEQSAGIIGNLVVESGMDPTIKQGGGSIDPNNPTETSGAPGRGIAQWTVDERWLTLISFAAASAKDPLALQTQLEFIWFELTGEPPLDSVPGGASYGTAYSDLRATSTIPEAVESFVVLYEGAGIPHTERRIAEAQAAYDAFASSVTGPYMGCSNAGTVSIEGFYFPVETTKSAISAGAPNDAGEVLVWSHTCQEVCHHDYNAADIHVMPGTRVVAAKPGTVVSARERLGGSGSAVTIMGDDNVLYYYTHMTHNSLVVSEGETVVGGQFLGEVGVPSQAQNTASHLHFDALPGDQYDFRPSCSSAECSGYPFINISPILSRLYEELPD